MQVSQNCDVDNRVMDQGLPPYRSQIFVLDACETRAGRRMESQTLRPYQLDEVCCTMLSRLTQSVGPRIEGFGVLHHSVGSMLSKPLSTYLIKSTCITLNLDEEHTMSDHVSHLCQSSINMKSSIKELTLSTMTLIMLASLDLRDRNALPK